MQIATMMQIEKEGRSRSAHFCFAAIALQPSIWHLAGAHTPRNPIVSRRAMKILITAIANPDRPMCPAPCISKPRQEARNVPPLQHVNLAGLFRIRLSVGIEKRLQEAKIAFIGDCKTKMDQFQRSFP